MDALYSAAKGVFYVPLRFGLRWTMEHAERIPRDGPAILVSNHVSYLDPLTLAWVANRSRRRIRFLAKTELFDKQPLGAMLRAANQIPVARGSRDAQGALDAAVDALVRGECVAVFPEGTITPDLEPMAGKSGTARLAKASGVPVTPVGLWGTHRILYKGRKPRIRWGIAQTAVVGEPVVVGPDAHVKEATEQIMDAIRSCVARAREIYPQRPAPGGDAWWWRDPETALR